MNPNEYSNGKSNESQTSLESGELLSCKQRNKPCVSSRFTRVDGPWSWIVSVFLLFCILLQYGCTSTYGILFPDILRSLKSSRALTAIPGSAAVANTGILGIFVGKLCDHFGSRKILFTGSIVSAVGMVSSSFAPNIAVLIGTFGFLLGTGSCMVYFSTMMAIPIYFEKYKFEALSLVSAGPGSSLLVMTPVVQNLNQSLDWRKCMLVMVAFSIAPFVVSLLMRSKNPNDKVIEAVETECDDEEKSTCHAGDICYFSALKIKRYLLATLMLAISCFGHSMPFVHMAKLAEDIGIGSKRSSWLYFIIGFCSTASRLLVGKFGKHGPLSLPNISLLGNIVLALGNFILPSTSAFYALVIYSVGYGVGEGLLITPVINIVIDSVPVKKRGRGYGVFQLIISVPYIVGPVVSGYIADVSGSYKTAFYLAASLEVFGGCLCLLFRFIQPSSDKDEICISTALYTDLVIVDKETVL